MPVRIEAAHRTHPLRLSARWAVGRPGTRATFEADLDAVTVTLARRNRLDEQVTGLAMHSAVAPMTRRSGCQRDFSTLTSLAIAVDPIALDLVGEGLLEVALLSGVDRVVGTVGCGLDLDRSAVWQACDLEVEPRRWCLRELGSFILMLL